MADPANECFALRREDGSLTGEIKTARVSCTATATCTARATYFWRGCAAEGPNCCCRSAAHRRTRSRVCMIFRRPGYLDPGEDFAAAARRELAEELGVTGEEPEFLFAQRNEYHGAFHGKPFHDNEIAWVYLLVLDRPEEAFTPEACEVESVHWFSVREILRAMRENDPRFCLREAEFCRLLPYLAQKFGIPVDKL